MVSTVKTPILQQNREILLNGGVGQQLKPQFRRQGSSFGGTGHVSPMAVMVLPNRVDYSVTKGGLRSWVVLLVFILLCSGFYTLFSSRELAEVTPDIDIDERKNVHLTTEDFDNEESVEREESGETTKKSKRKKLTQKEKEKKKLEEEKEKVEIHFDSDIDENDDDEEEPSKEELLFAGLQAKIQRKMKERSRGKSIKVLEKEKAGKEHDQLALKESKEIGSTENTEEEKEQNNEENENDVEEEENEEEVEMKNEIVNTDEVDEQKQSELSTAKTSYICHRKKCSNILDESPRMELLKKRSKKTQSQKNRLKRYQFKELYNDDTEDLEEINADDDNEGDNLGEGSEETACELTAVKKERPVGRLAYKRHAITNRDDHRYRERLDMADGYVEKHAYSTAIEIFNGILEYTPDSPRAHFGKARAFEIRSEMDYDPSLLDTAMKEYQEVLNNGETPDALFEQAAYRLVEIARFRGSLHKALIAQRSLIDRYPYDLKLQSKFGLTFLMMGRIEQAKKVFWNILQSSPSDGFAQAYYGYVLKLSGDVEHGIFHMSRGLHSAYQYIKDPRFYFHLGDGLTRLGRTEDAYKVYEIGAKVGLFPSIYQRSLNNINGLTARPWWSIDQTTYMRQLKNIERKWAIITEEASALLKYQEQLFHPENAKITEGGEWLAYYLYRNGVWETDNCRRIEKACQMLKTFRDSSNSTKNQIKFSVLTSGTRVWPHCGNSNYRLQAHLGLMVPSEARIRVANETRGWKVGKFIIFDDSFEQEMWFSGASASKITMVLVIDLWHPEIDPLRRIEYENL